MEFAPACSPDAEKPCRSRSSTSNAGGERADLAVGRQQADREGRDAHQDQCGDQDTSCGRTCRRVAHEEGADRPRHVADAERRAAKRWSRRFGCPGGRRCLRKHQGGRSAVDEEVVVLQYAADPGGYRRLLRRPYALRFVGALRLDDDFVHPELLGPSSGCEDAGRVCPVGSPSDSRHFTTYVPVSTVLTTPDFEGR